MPTDNLPQSVQLKLQRASEHINHVNKIISEQRPFSYVLETNTRTGERATFAKKNEPAVDLIQQVAHEAVHALRSALDHVYWEIVSPFAKTPKEERAIQFPFCERANRLDEAVSNRLAKRVSRSFFDAIVSLKPYAEPGGNTLLYLIDKLDGVDKHRTYAPVGDYKRISSDLIRRQVPDFPRGITDASFGQCYRDVTWRVQNVDTRQLGKIRPPTTCVFEKELDVPVDIVFVITSPDFRGPVVPTLHKLADVTADTIRILRNATP